MKTWFAMVEIKDLKYPSLYTDLNLSENLWDELEHRLHTKPPHKTALGLLVSLMLRIFSEGQQVLL